jgi:hypothetical protein
MRRRTEDFAASSAGEPGPLDGTAVAAAAYPGPVRQTARGARVSGPVVSPKASRTSRLRALGARVLWFLVPSFLAALPLLLALFGSDSIRATRWDVWGIAAWFALLVAAEALPVPLPRGGTMTVASILDIGAILLFGPWVAGALDLLTALPAQLWILRNRPGASALNAGLAVASTAQESANANFFRAIPRGPPHDQISSKN